MVAPPIGGGAHGLGGAECTVWKRPPSMRSSTIRCPPASTIAQEMARPASRASVNGRHHNAFGTLMGEALAVGDIHAEKKSETMNRAQIVANIHPSSKTPAPARDRRRQPTAIPSICVPRCSSAGAALGNHACEHYAEPAEVDAWDWGEARRAARSSRAANLELRRGARTRGSGPTSARA